MIRAILACDENWGIGKDGDLPWPHNPADLRWFKNSTAGGVVVMGKATWDSLPKKPLPGRNNIVVTRSKDDKDGPYHFLEYDRAIPQIKSMSKIQSTWIIGGAQLVSSTMDIIDEIWLSRIEGKYPCDTFLDSNLIEENFVMFEVQDLPEENLYIEKWERK
jgi:dihydrofolate reductase